MVVVVVVVMVVVVMVMITMVSDGDSDSDGDGGDGDGGGSDAATAAAVAVTAAAICHLNFTSPYGQETIVITVTETIVDYFSRKDIKRACEMGKTVWMELAAISVYQ